LAIALNAFLLGEIVGSACDYAEALPPNFQIKITNPCGVIIMGRERGLTNAQLRDLEVTRRHYKHIADIVTYDELLRRLRFILEHLKAEA